MEFDHVLLSRLQFAFTVTFHIIFPSFTIGLASFLVVLQGMWMKTRDYAYLDLHQFWLKVFAVSFGMGVVSGIVMSFQFGTNWSVLSDKAGNVIGPLITYETTTAFFLEATFLGVMLFGRGRIPEGLHFFAACMVALGTFGSAFWILSANSWMHTPAGYELRDGIFYAANWLEIIFNPSFPYRFFHMVIGAFITTALVVAGVGAWYRLTKRSPREARVMLSMALWLLTFLVPIQVVVGHLSGVEMGKNQPVKMAAVGARWETEQPANLVLIAWPDEELEENLYAIVIPDIGGLIDADDYDAVMPGLKTWPREDRPPVIIPFLTFRIMVGCAMIMLLVVACGLFLRRGGRLYHSTPFLVLTLLASPLGFVAVITGWYTAEVGRQPWVVYNLLRTADAISPVRFDDVVFSFALVVVVYTIVFGAGFFYILRLIHQGIDSEDDGSQPVAQMAKRPLSASGRGFETRED